MKKTNYIYALALISMCPLGASTFLSGTALTNLESSDVGRVGAYVISTDGSPFSSISLTEGASITDGASYGSSFAFVNTNTVVDFFGIGLNSGGEVVYTGGVTAGDSFAVVLFGTSSSTAIAGDTFEIYSDSSWILPADTGANTNFGVAYNAINTSATGPVATNTVSPVPEPSSFALIAGCFGLALAVVRRRSRRA